MWYSVCSVCGIFSVCGIVCAVYVARSTWLAGKGAGRWAQVGRPPLCPGTGFLVYGIMASVNSTSFMFPCC